MVALDCLGVQPAGRSEEGDPEEFPVTLEPVTKHREAAFMHGVEGFTEVTQQCLPCPVLQDVFKILPFLRLGLPDEREHGFRVDAAFPVEGLGRRLGIAPLCQEVVLDCGFECYLPVVCWHGVSSRLIVLS